MRVPDPRSKRRRIPASTRLWLNRRSFVKLALALAGGALFNQVCSHISGPNLVRSLLDEPDPADLPADLQSAPNVNGRYDVVVVGGGISGLTTAYLLRYKNVLLLEKEPTAGGRIISGQWEGFHYPKGAEYIGPPEYEMAALFQALGIQAVPVPPPTDAVAYGGQIYWGANLLDFLSAAGEADYWDLEARLIALNDGGIEEAVFDYPHRLPNYASLDAQSVYEWLQARNYDPLVQLFVDVENRGLFGANNQDLSFLFDVPEMAYDLPDPDESHLSEVYTFPLGMTEVVDALLARLPGRVQTGAEVTQVTVNADDSVSVTYQQNAATTTVQADCVVLTTPAPITDSIVSNGFSTAVRQALGQVHYGVYVTLNLFTSTRLWKDAWMMACLDRFFVTLYDGVRMQVPLSYTGKSILGVYVAPLSASDTSLLYMSDGDLLESVLSDLEGYYPAIRSQVLGYDVQRFQYAFPVFGKNYHQTLLALLQDSTTQGPLFLAGDYMVYAILDGAILSAFRAHEQVAEYLGYFAYLPIASR